MEATKHAVFLAPINVIEAATERAGLESVINEFTIGGESIFILSQTVDITAVSGDTHAIMRLIGAFADDGMDCLVRCSV